MSLWTIDDFKSKNLDIDQASLDSLIDEITGKINRFIAYDSLSNYRNAYEIDFIEEINYLTPYVEIGYEKELEIVQAFYSAVTAITGFSRISLKKLGQIVGLSDFRQASKGHRFSIGSFRKMVSFLETLIKVDNRVFVIQTNLKYDFMSRLTLDQRLEIYKSARKMIQEYMREFDMKRPKNWDEENVKANQIFKILERNVGFDVLGFTTLDKNIFTKIKDKINSFARHHFRNDFFRKLSNYVQDLILTDSKNHRKYESYSEAQILVILDGFDRMMNEKGSGKDGAITKNDVINIFRENEWVLKGPNLKGGKKKDQGWFFSKTGFDNMLKEFNDRKNLLKNEGLLQFIIEKYDIVYERFYRNLPDGTANAKGFYSLVAPHPLFGDYAMWIDMFAGFWLPDF